MSKEKALEKLNLEMHESHTSYEDYIHNWLSDQDDDDLFEKVIVEGKTIKSCYKYIQAAAYKLAVRIGNVASHAFTPEEVNSLVREYYMSDITVVIPRAFGDVNVNNASKSSQKQTEVSKEKPSSTTKFEIKKEREYEMPTIFDFANGYGEDSESNE